MTSGARKRFAALVSGSEDRIDLAEAALLIAAEEKPGLDVPYHLGQLDTLAGDAKGAVEGAGSDLERLRGLNRFLYSEEGFSGNRKSYYDPRNSFLDEVLERRTGLPITLGIVYTEVARRLGLEVHGVCFPAHFLCKLSRGQEIIIDPFDGEILTRADCEVRLRQALGERAVLEAGHLRDARPREILARLLGNLKHVYVARSDLERSLACCDRILMLTPDSPTELRDRGVLYQKLECFAGARADFERFLQLAPNDPSADAVRGSLVDLLQRTRQIH